MLNLERITQCTIIGCVCLGPKVGEVILHGSSQWDSCYAITHSLTTLHWRNIGPVLDGMDLQLDWGSTFPTIFSSLRPFHKHSPSSSWPVIAFWWWFGIFVVSPCFPSIFIFYNNCQSSVCKLSMPSSLAKKKVYNPNFWHLASYGVAMKRVFHNIS